MKKAGYELALIEGIESTRMKILKVIFSPILLLVGFDVCYMQIMFKAVLCSCTGKCAV